MTLALTQSKNWPHYRSFKTVKASRIVEIPEFAQNQEVGNIVVCPDFLEDVSDERVYYRTITVNPKQLFARGLAKPGDYYVVYEDGYDSWSPKDTFEKGYLLLNGDPKDNLSLNATKQDWNFIRSHLQFSIGSTNKAGASYEYGSEEEREAVEGFLRMTESCVVEPKEGSKDNV